MSSEHLLSYTDEIFIFVDGIQNRLVGTQLPKIEFPFNYLGEGGPSIVF